MNLGRSSVILSLVALLTAGCNSGTVVEQRQPSSETTFQKGKILEKDPLDVAEAKATSPATTDTVPAPVMPLLANLSDAAKDPLNVAEAKATSPATTDTVPAPVMPVLANLSDAAREKAWARIEKLKQIDGKLMTEWAEAMDEATGERPEFGGMFIVVSKVMGSVPFLDPAWNPDDSPNSDALRIYTKRLQSLPPRTVSAFRDLLAGKTEAYVEKKDAAMTLILQDRVFSDDTFDQEKYDAEFGD